MNHSHATHGAAITYHSHDHDATQQQQDATSGSQNAAAIPYAESHFSRPPYPASVIREHYADEELMLTPTPSNEDGPHRTLSHGGQALSAIPEEQSAAGHSSSVKTVLRAPLTAEPQSFEHHERPESSTDGARSGANSTKNKGSGSNGSGHHGHHHHSSHHNHHHQHGSSGDQRRPLLPGHRLASNGSTHGGRRHSHRHGSRRKSSGGASLANPDADEPRDRALEEGMLQYGSFYRYSMERQRTNTDEDVFGRKMFAIAVLGLIVVFGVLALSVRRGGV